MTNSMWGLYCPDTIQSIFFASPCENTDSHWFWMEYYWLSPAWGVTGESLLVYWTPPLLLSWLTWSNTAGRFSTTLIFTTAASASAVTDWKWVLCICVLCGSKSNGQVGLKEKLSNKNIFILPILLDSSSLNNKRSYENKKQKFTNKRKLINYLTRPILVLCVTYVSNVSISGASKNCIHRKQQALCTETWCITYS